MRRRNLLETFLQFYTSLARPSPLTILHVELQEARRYVRMFITALTAPYIHPFQLKNSPPRSYVFRREPFCLAIFYANCLSFHLFRKFFFLFYLSVISIWRQGSAGATNTSDKARRQKRTADNRTQQRTPSNYRQEQAAPASPSEATEHHTAGNDADNSTKHDRRHSRTTQHRTRGQSTTRCEDRGPGNSNRLENKGSRSAEGGQSRTTRHNQINAVTRSGPDNQTTQRTTTPHSSKANTTTHNNTRGHHTRQNTAQNSRTQQGTAQDLQQRRS